VKVSTPALASDLVGAMASWTEQDTDPQTRQHLEDLLSTRPALLTPPCQPPPYRPPRQSDKPA
jgi:hypothetical protein